MAKWCEWVKHLLLRCISTNLSIMSDPDLFLNILILCSQLTCIRHTFETLPIKFAACMMNWQRMLWLHWYIGTGAVVMMNFILCHISVSIFAANDHPYAREVLFKSKLPLVMILFTDTIEISLMKLGRDYIFYPGLLCLICTLHTTKDYRSSNQRTSWCEICYLQVLFHSTTSVLNYVNCLILRIKWYHLELVVVTT